MAASVWLCSLLLACFSSLLVLPSVLAQDSMVPALLTRQPVLNLNFSTRPSFPTNWQWSATDPADSGTAATLHQGVALLNGSATSWINLTDTLNGPQSAGVTLPGALFGGPGFGGSGWSIEVVVKFPVVVQDLSSCLILLQDAIGSANSYTTFTWGNTFDAGDVDVGNRLIATQYEGSAALVPSNASFGHIEFLAPVANTWYHIVWTFQPYPSATSGTAVWCLYVNGQLLNWAQQLVPSSTLTPIQGANYPQASVRNVANLGKDTATNTFIATVDALRIYDYTLTQAQVTALANAYQLNIVQPTQTSYAFATSSETTQARALVPIAPIFNAVFSVNPNTATGISSTAYTWLAADPADSPAAQQLHPGVIQLNGSPASYVNLQLATGPNSIGQVVPIVGLPGSGGGTSGQAQGLSFEMTFKLPSAINSTYQSSKLFDLGQGGTETIDMAAQSSGSLQLEMQNNFANGVEANSYASTYTAQGGFLGNNNAWNHVVWVLSNPNLANYSASWTIYINGTAVPTIGGAYIGLFPLPVYRPLSFLGGSDYNNANLIITIDAFRIYDYALSAATVSTLYNTLYNPGGAVGTSTGSSGGGSGTCTTVTGSTGGDFAVAGLVSRAPVLNLNFTSSPTCSTGVAPAWTWAASDTTDTSANAALHQGVAVLTGAATSWIDLTTASGSQSAGVALPGKLFGGPGFGGSGWSIEVVVKFPVVVQDLSSCLILLQDAIGSANSYTTFTWGNTFDAGDVDVGNRLIATQYEGSAALVPSNASFGHIEFLAPVANTWYHIVWTFQPYPSATSGTAVWCLYVNGQLLNWAQQLVPSSTLTPIQGANYPQASVRNVANLGKDTATNTFIATVDALRIYDYTLTQAQVTALANAYQLNIVQPTQTSYAFATSSETTQARALVPIAPIFNAVFSVNPNTATGISSTAYTWLAADPADSPAAQQLHPGVIQLNGSPASYVNLQLATGPNSIGQVVPIVGLPGSGGGTSGQAQGLSFEMTFKLPSAINSTYQSSKLFDLGQGGTETIDMAAQSSGSLQLEMQNNFANGVEANSYAATYTAQGGFLGNNNAWNHVVWVLSNPNLANYSASWTIYINGTAVPTIGGAYIGLFPLPVYRPLSFLGGSDYNNANLIITIDAFRIYDYALSAATVSTLYNTLYNPGGAVGTSTGSSGGGSGTCTTVTGSTGGDFAVAGLVSRAPVLNLNFTSSPTCSTGVAPAWTWAASDTTDTSANAALHQGVAVLTGAATSWIDLTTASGSQSAGVALPGKLFGGPGFGGSGWSIEVVVKFPVVVQDLSSCLILLQDAIGSANSYTTFTWGNTFDAGDVDVGNRLIATQYEGSAALVPSNASFGHIEFLAPVANTWYHIVWTFQPYPSATSGTAVWCLYVNGQLLNWAQQLVPSSTLTPIQGANYPQASVRNVANLGKDTVTNTFIATVDALRIYDYTLTQAQVTALANAYQLNIVQPTQTSYAFATSSETTQARALVPIAPIFNAVFSVNPNTATGISSTAYTWLAADPADSPAAQQLHPGVIQLNGSPASYVNLQLATGPNSIGQVVPIVGLPGSGGGTSGQAQGLSFEMTFKLPSAINSTYQSSKLFDLGQGGTETIDMAAQSSGSLQLEMQNNFANGVEANSYAATYTAQGGFLGNNNAWNHVVWVLSNPNLANYSASWTIYINGTAVPTIGGAYIGLFPLPVYRPLSFLGGSDYNNANLIITIDAFRIYDYALSAATVSTLYNTLYGSNAGPSAGPAPSGRSSSSGAASPTASPSLSTGAVAPTPGSSSSSSGLSGGAIAGIVVGSVVGVLLILCLIFFLLTSASRGKKSQRLDETHDTHRDTHQSDSHHDDEHEVEMAEQGTA